MDVAAVGEVSIVVILSVLSKNGSKEWAWSSMVKELLLQLTSCDDSEKSSMSMSMLCDGEAIVCFLCCELNVILQTCIMEEVL